MPKWYEGPAIEDDLFSSASQTTDQMDTDSDSEEELDDSEAWSESSESEPEALEEET